MSFPFSNSFNFEHQSEFSKNPENKLLFQLENFLERYDFRKIIRKDNKITFNGTRWLLIGNVINIFSKGEITIEKYDKKLIIYCTVKFTGFLYLTSAMILLFFGHLIFASSNMNYIEKLLILSIAWLWLYGGNFIFAIYRFKYLLRKEIMKNCGICQ